MDDVVVLGKIEKKHVQIGVGNLEWKVAGFPIWDRANHDWEGRVPRQNEDVTHFSHWHTDSGSYGYLIVWSNIYPTQVKLPSGKIITPNDNEVVMFNNEKLEHRINPGYIRLVREATFGGNPVPERYFARLLINQEPSVDQVIEWMEALEKINDQETQHQA